MAPEKDEPVDWPEEAPTKVTCYACGGQYERVEETFRGHRMSKCRWCTNGAMSPDQVRAWMDRGGK